MLLYKKLLLMTFGTTLVIWKTATFNNTHSAPFDTENVLAGSQRHDLNPTYMRTKTSAVPSSPLAPTHPVDKRSAVHCSC